MYTIFIIANSSEVFSPSHSFAALRFKLNMLISAEFIIKRFFFKLGLLASNKLDGGINVYRERKRKKPH